MFLPFWLLPYTCALAFCEGLTATPKPPTAHSLPPGAYAEAVTGRCDVIAFGTGRKL